MTKNESVFKQLNSIKMPFGFKFLSRDVLVTRLSDLGL